MVAMKDVTVNLETLTPAMIIGVLVAYDVFNSHNSVLVITSGDDGTHMAGSKHYNGNAVDIRSHDLHGIQALMVVHLKKQLGDRYDVLLEDPGGPNEHIHIEYDPRMTDAAAEQAVAQLTAEEVRLGDLPHHGHG